jgi:hypothetical protein
MFPRVVALVGLSASVLVSSCGALATQSVQPAGSTAAASSGRPTVTASGEVDGTGLPLDAMSRDLLAVMDPAERAHVVVATTWTAELSRTAAGARMRVEVVEAGTSIAIDGPVGEVLALVETAPVTAVTVQDSMEAMRRIADQRPVVNVPNPARPYRATGFVGDLGNVVIASPQREAMLSSLAETIRTIDGQPYVRLEMEGSCGSDKSGASCGLIAVGFASGSVGREDEWSLRGREGIGWRGVIESVRTTSVPRPLLRAAEWIARHDQAALARIRTYTACCSVSWDPERPGRITLIYDRLCMNAELPGRDLAETGECRDELAITVDLGAGTVVSIGAPARG